MSNFKIGAEVLIRRRNAYDDGFKTLKILKVYKNENVLVEGYGNQQWRASGETTLIKTGKGHSCTSRIFLDLVTTEILDKAREQQLMNARVMRLRRIRSQIDNIGRHGHPAPTDMFLNALEAEIERIYGPKEAVNG